MSDEEAMLRALAQGSGVVFDRLEEGGPGLAKLRAQLAALRPLLAAREAAVRAEERERCVNRIILLARSLIDPPGETSTTRVDPAAAAAGTKGGI